MTRAVGWAAARCVGFRQALCRFLLGVAPSSKAATIWLQRFETEAGITDIEIEVEDEYQIIIEAKRGWELPSRKQLATYASRMKWRHFRWRVLVALTDASPEYAKLHFNHSPLHGIPVVHMSWSDLLAIASRTEEAARGEERIVMSELTTYLDEKVTLQDVYSNMVWIAPLRDATQRGGTSRGLMLFAQSCVIFIQ